MWRLKLKEMIEQARALSKLTPRSWVLLWKHQSLCHARILHFLKPEVFITVFTGALYRFLLWARLTHFIPHYPISLISTLILSAHLHVGRPSGLFRSGFPTKILYAFIFSIMHATRLASLILLDLIVLIIFKKSTSYEAPHYAIQERTLM
jgi:hypothetical protein